MESEQYTLHYYELAETIMNDLKETKKKQKDRSVAYPGVSLSDAIESTGKLRDSLGRGPYSREEAAKALGHTQLTGPAARKVAALAHYGLLERTGNTYSQSQLAQDILKPLSDEQKEVSIKRAAISPRLFLKLCERFNGQALPSMLQNIVIREGVSEGAANEVVRIFTETMQFAKILVNGVIVVDAPSEDGTDTEQPTVSIPQNSTRIASPQQRNREVGDDSFVFEFTGGIRLVIPQTKKTSEAIADGELKNARKELSSFADKFMKPMETSAAEDSPAVD